MTTSVGNNLVFRSFFEKQKLIGPNFIDWYRQLHIILSVEDKENYLEHPIPAAPVAAPRQQVPPQALAAHAAWVKGSKEIDALMLMTMDLDIQRNLTHLGAYDMLQELKTMFAQQAEHELLQTVREFHACKQEEGQSVSSYVLKMKSYIDNLERLGQPVSLRLAVSLILISLSKECDGFVQNYNMQRMGKTRGRVQKNQKKKPHKAAKGNQGKGKAKMGYAPVPTPSFAPKPKNPPPPKKDNTAKDAICHQCGEVGHCRRNCPVYLAELLKKKKLSQGASTSGIFTIELYSFPSTSWVYDTGCGTHIYITTQGLRRSRKLKPYHLFSMNNLVYFCAIPRDGIYEIDLSSSNTNDSSMYAVSNKRAKLNLDSSLLWHCRLGHISKKRIEKLQHDGLLNSTDIKSFEKYVSCMSGKMARKPYSHQVERAKDLLGLIHTDVCAPFRTVSRQGASYFVTFIDDFSRYGYVYLLKHKHKVFKTFKVFQKEDENQLGKTIKSLRSDCGGEYMSQEFLDHLKEHVIIAHRTPPYTPQHNGVSERRNRILLDMVHSMMSQTTLPKSFWDYALESAARILNMVPTNKVDKTPYEVWHGQAPKLSYLKVWGCEALVKRDTDKLEPRSIKCIFVRYPKETMRYSFYYPPENKIFVARNAEFFENSLITQEESGSLEDLEIIQEEDTKPFIDTSLNHEEDDQEIDEPQSDINPIHALFDPESDKWLDAMNVEMQSMKDNEVWNLVDLPPNGKTVGSKWLFKKKTDMDDIRAIRILIAITAFYDYEIWQMDVKIVFLNGHLSEEVYMVKPEGFVNPNFQTDFSQNRNETCVYMKASGSYVTILILYVDDILIMGNNIPMLQVVKSYLGRCFAMKDLEEAAYILGIKIYRDRSKRLIGLCQSAYIEKILKRYFMENSKRGSILMVSCYTDAGYLTDANDLKSQTGYVFILNGGAVEWKSTKQSIFATSSTEAEYIAAYDASKEAVWIQKFISGLGIVPTIKEPIKMYCDNTGAIAIAKESGITKGARHYRAKVHYLREVIEYGDVKIEKVHTYDNLADPFTKALPYPKHLELTKNI
ncbi:retrotransposon protein, putative, ty1-copia subclass [Tanacetum coccineum]